MRRRPPKLATLPSELLKAIECRLRKRGFNGYKKLATWIGEQGHNISIASLKRFRARLTQPRTPKRTVKRRTGSSSWGATQEELMKLMQEKLRSALSEIHQFEDGHMSRLAHALAHLTQAGVSLQRWNEQFDQRAMERKRGRRGERSISMRGLSPGTSQALRNALLGIAPLDQPANREKHNDEQRETTYSPDADTEYRPEHDKEVSLTGGVARLKGRQSSDKQDDE